MTLPKASPPVVALAFVLAGSAVWAEPTDYVLEIDGGRVPGICAKSETTCRGAIEAIRNGWNGR